MSSQNSKRLVPRNGHTLHAGLGARISGCANQKELSLDDQVDHGKQVIAELYDGPVEYHVIATKGKGEALDRPELQEIKDALRKGGLDVFVLEDLGRLVRGSEAVRLLGIAVDHGVRVIATNDCIDTAEDSWEEDAISACRDHVGHNAHTSKRLKHKLMNRFLRHGQALPLMIFGYIKPSGAKSYGDIIKDSSAGPIYQEMFRRLRAFPNCSAVSDWLQQSNIPTGPYTRRKTWDGKMVRRIVANPLLKGRPGRGFRHTVKNHETGRRKSEKNPGGPNYIDCPHLAHVDPALWDEVNELIVRANKRCSRPAINGVDPRWHTPRKRTRFPGQHARCWYCGRQYVWGANGITGNLMCSGARDRSCWNSIGFEGALAGKKLVGVIKTELYAMAGFDEQFREMVIKATEGISGDAQQQWDKLKAEETSGALQKENLTSAIAKLGLNPMLEQKFLEIEETDRQLLRRRQALESLQERKLQLPASPTELRQMLEEEFERLTIDSPEFGDSMRRLVPQLDVYLVRSCDGGHLLSRAKVMLNLGGMIDDVMHVPGLTNLLSRQITIDLFEPPQRERIRKQAVELVALGYEQRQIADRIDEKPTQTGSLPALLLDRAMREADLTSPYVTILEPPNDYSKLRRHYHQQYHFTMKENYQPQPL